MSSQLPSIFDTVISTRRIGSLLALLAATWTPPCLAETIATWSFESYVPSATLGQFEGPIPEDFGVGDATGFHQTATLWSTPTGNGSAKSLASGGWTTGDYLEFYVPTLGYENISFAWDQSRASTGPTTFALQYSLDGNDFTQFGANVSVLAIPPNPAWSAAVNNVSYRHSFNLSSINTIENSEVYFRLVNVTAAASPGLVRFDNVVVSGTAAPSGVDRYWTNPGNGIFSSSSNWLGGAVPILRDSAHFEVGRAAHTVSFSSNTATGAIYVTGDQVTLNLNTRIYTTTADVRDSIYVNNNFTDYTSKLRVTNGTLAAQGASVGGAAGTQSALEVVGATARLELSDAFGELLVGAAGAGTFLADDGAQVEIGQAGMWIGGNPDTAIAASGLATISNGAQVVSLGPALLGEFGGDGELRIESGGSLQTAVSPSGSQIGVESGGVNQASVSGAGSQWTEAGSLSVGYFGSGTLTVSAQGVLTSGNGYVAQFADAAGTSLALVSGAGSRWNVGNLMAVGSDGAGNTGVGELRLTSGGVVSIGSRLVLGSASEVDVEGGRVTVGTAATSVAGAVSIGADGELIASGVITGSVINNGNVAPGPSIGALQVTGDFQQQSGGTLTMQLTGTTPGSSVDQLNVGGQLSLDGTLEVILAGGFDPAAGDAFDLLGTWGSRVGTFDSIELPTLMPGLSWNTSLLYATGELSVTGDSFLAGDFDENGTVNGDDLADWKAGYGDLTGATHAQGDADGDQDVDGADFLVWQRQVGSGPGATVGSAVVPEPAAVVLAATACLAIVAGCSNRGRRHATAR